MHEIPGNTLSGRWKVESNQGFQRTIDSFIQNLNKPNIAKLSSKVNTLQSLNKRPLLPCMLPVS